MAKKESLTLRIAAKKDFAVLNRMLFLLAVVSAALSPQPVLLVIFTVLVIGAGCVSRTLCFSKVNGVELTLVIFSDGRIDLGSSCGLKLWEYR